MLSTGRDMFWSLGKGKHHEQHFGESFREENSGFIAPVVLELLNTEVGLRELKLAYSIPDTL